MSTRTRLPQRLRPSEFVVGLLFGSTTVQAHVPRFRPLQRLLLLGTTSYIVHEHGLLIGGEGAGGGRNTPLGRGEASIGMGLGAAEVGVIALPTRPIRIFPFLGVGGAGSGMAYFRRSIQELYRHHQPIQPDVVKASGGPHLLLGLAIEIRIGRHTGLLFGLRIAYLFMPFYFGSRRLFPGGPLIQCLVGAFHRRSQSQSA